jgi:glucose/arabinose dehydrogenase
MLWSRGFRHRTSMPVKLSAWVLLSAAFVLLSLGANAQGLLVTRVATGLERPLFLTHAPGDTARVFIAEQHSGEIRILRRPAHILEDEPFLTVPGISRGSEQGLLGLAFHPNYAFNGLFYVYITDPTSRVLRYRVALEPGQLPMESDVADPSSELPVLSFTQPQSNHNGGWIAFGPDDYLYIASGDGGSGYDSGTGHTAGIGNAQDLTDNLLGKILRVDVDGDSYPGDPSRNYAIPDSNPFVDVTGDDEIWAYGLRNPYRSSFDRATGDLYIADVGQAHCEELDVQPANSPGGENYGWRLREGVIATPGGGVGGSAPPDAINPIMDYAHPTVSEVCSNPGAGFRGVAVTGGYVYRGPVPELQGRYVFADFSTGHIWSLLWDGTAPSTFDGTNYTDLTEHSTDFRFTPDQGSIAAISSFGEDADGNLYVVNLNQGEVHLVPEPPAMLAQTAGSLCLLALAHLRRRHANRARPPKGAHTGV